jgi:hypothetical protein
MKYLIIVLLFSLGLSNQALGQDHKKNNIYFEYNNAIWLSINYNRIVYDNLGIRVGAGYCGFEFFAFPLLANYRFYVNDSYFEAGAGITHTTGKIGLGLNDEGFSDWLPTCAIGFRLQHKRGMNAGLSVTSYYVNNELKTYIGLSLGFAF